jgi:hypothetical protein
VVAAEKDFGFRFPEDGRNYVIPIIWQTQKAYLLVCLS